MKLFIVVILMIQVGLLSFGVWQVQQPSGFIMGCGVFNIVFNVIFGGINIHTLMCT